MSGSGIAAATTALRTAIAGAGSGLIEREVLVDLVGLAAVASEHVLVIGPPGTAKSEAVRRLAHALGGRYFEYLLGRFTEPSEIFGPIDIRKLREGVVETEVSGMLPEAEIAFLDEVFQGSNAILNTLLGILNEREFRRGHTRLRCPLRVCIGASNALPEDDTLAAFADRFLVRCFVAPLPDARLEELLAGGWSLGQGESGASASIGDLDLLARAARAVDLVPVRPLLAQAIRLLREAGIQLSDRRSVRLQRLVAAAAVIAGRTAAGPADLWPIVAAVPTQAGQALAREALRDLLAPADNPVLPWAAEEASLGRLPRARRLAVAASEALAAADGAGAGEEAHRAARSRLEAIAREIDAAFAGDLPPELSAARAAVVARLERPAAS